MQFLAECKNKIEHSEEDVNDELYSWRKSISSTQNLLRYICNLEPHSLKVMMSINNASHTVSMMSKLLLDMTMCIANDVGDMKEKEKEAERIKQQIAKNPKSFASDTLRALLHVTETTVTTKKLEHQNVVCESGPCGKVVEVEEGGKKFTCIVYPQVCCESCSAASFGLFFLFPF